MPENASKTLKSSPAPAEPTKQPEVASEETTAPKTNEELFSEALAANSAADALAVLQSCSPDELKSFGANDSMMESVLNLNAGDAQSACMDMLYVNVTTPSILERFAETRFGVNIGSGSTQGNNLAKKVNTTTVDANNPNKVTERVERSWDIPGLQRLYACYLVLPQSHIDVVDSVLTTTDRVTNGTTVYDSPRTGGVAYYNYNSYVVDYNSARYTRERGNAGYCTSDQDACYYNPMLDTTIVHELGHLVDGGNHQYAWSDEFLAFNEWKEIASTRDDNKKFVKQIIADCSVDPFVPMVNVPDGGDRALSKDELKLAKRGAELLIANHESKCTTDVVESVLTQASNEFGFKFVRTLKKGAETVGNFFSGLWNKITGQESQTEEKEDDLRSLDSLAEYLIETPVYQHILKTALCIGSSRIPCYQFDNNGTPSYMDKVTFEGYDGRQIWQVSLKNWYGNKISRYQFRCPEEDFAETYSCYHVSKMQRQLHEGETDAETKYKGIPSDVQDWFERMGLHQDPPVENAKQSDEPLGQ